MGYRNGAIVHVRDDTADKCLSLVTTNDNDQYDGPIDGVVIEASDTNGTPGTIETRLDVAHDAMGPPNGAAILTDGTWHYLGECPDQFGAPAL